MKRIESPSPQIEDGHLDLANELVEALSKLRISGQEMQCLWVIWRKTYCWHKLSDTIALSQFQVATGLPKSNICRAIKKLLSKKIITVIKKDNSEWMEYRFNKHYLEWEPLSKKIRGIIKKDNEVQVEYSPDEPSDETIPLPKKITGGSKPAICVINFDNDHYQKRDPQKKPISKESYLNNNPPTPQGGEVSATGEKEKPKRKKFVVPTLDEVFAYCKERNNLDIVDPEGFIAHYNSNGWKVGKNPMVCWKSAVITFEKMAKERVKKELKNKPREDEEAFYPTFTDRRSFYGSDDNEEERKKAQEAFAKANNIKTDEAENAN